MPRDDKCYGKNKQGRWLGSAVQPPLLVACLLLSSPASQNSKHYLKDEGYLTETPCLLNELFLTDFLLIASTDHKLTTVIIPVFCCQLTTQVI